MWLNLKAMKIKPYALIILLLATSMLALLLIQAFWIKNFYKQKSEAFDANVFASIEKIRLKLNNRESSNLKNFNGDSTIQDFKTKNNSNHLKSNPSHQSINHNGINPIDQVITASEIKVENEKIKTGDSTFEIMKMPNAKNLKFIKGVGAPINFSIKIVDTDETNLDTLNAIIKHVFISRGLFLPFEFALKKINAQTIKTITSTKNFKNELKCYTLDLSLNKPFTTNNFLFIQFPTQKEFVISSIKTVLMLAIIFSLVMFTIFYFSVRMMLKQKKLNEIKNDFINNMTHELKTPIATIALATDAISNPQIKNNEEKFTHYTHILKEENKKLNAHVERVLEMALINKGELVLNKKKSDLIEIIKVAIQSHRLNIETRKAKVNFNYSTKIELLLDENHILAVFNNLIDNALKYSNSNCIINIEIISSTEIISVSVKDNGIGIDTNLLTKIFEKFYRVQSGNVHDIKGFGLGLFYVKSILTAHGADIEVNSEKTIGSEFIIKFKNNG